MPREIKSKKSKASGLGKGLENLMKVDSVESVLPDKEIYELPISELVPNVDQPRKSFDEDSLATLAESIKNLGISNLLWFVNKRINTKLWLVSAVIVLL